MAAVSEGIGGCHPARSCGQEEIAIQSQSNSRSVVVTSCLANCEVEVLGHLADGNCNPDTERKLLT